MLQDMVLAAVNEALRSARSCRSRSSAGWRGGFDPMRRSTRWAGWAASAAAGCPAAR